MLLAFTIAFAATPGAAGTTPQPTEVKEERKICKRDAATGTRMGSKRICRTAAEWRLAEGEGLDTTKLHNAMRQQ